MTFPFNYILDDAGEPKPEPDLLAWAAWFGTGQRIVAQDYVGETLVSTVFLGLDHRFGAGPPILWETMTHDGKNWDQLDRCSGSREQAMAMHMAMVEKVRAMVKG